MADPQLQGQIEGLPPGAILKPIQQPAIQGLPPGAILRPIGDSAPVQPSMTRPEADAYLESLATGGQGTYQPPKTPKFADTALLDPNSPVFGEPIKSAIHPDTTGGRNLVPIQNVASVRQQMKYEAEHPEEMAQIAHSQQMDTSLPLAERLSARAGLEARKRTELGLATNAVNEQLQNYAGEKGAKAGESFIQFMARNFQTENPQATPVEIGVARSIGKNAAQLAANPITYATAPLGAGGKLGQIALSALFAAGAGKASYDAAGQLGSIWDRPDISSQQKTELASDLIINTAVAGLAGTHAVKTSFLTGGDPLLSQIPQAYRNAVKQRVNSALTKTGGMLSRAADLAAEVGNADVEGITQQGLPTTVASKGISKILGGGPEAMSKKPIAQQTAAGSATNAQVRDYAASKGVDLLPGQATGARGLQTVQAIGERAVVAPGELPDILEKQKAAFGNAIDDFKARVGTEAIPNTEAAGQSLKSQAQHGLDTLKQSAQKDYQAFEKQAGDIPVDLSDVKAKAQASLASQAEALKNVPAKYANPVRNVLKKLSDLQAGPEADPATLKSFNDAVESYGLNAEQQAALRTKLGLPDEAGNAAVKMSTAQQLRSAYLDISRDYSGNVPKSVQRYAGQAARDIDAAMAKAADQAGAKDQWRQANAKWKQLQETYNNPEHPLYKVLQEPDPSKVPSKLIGKGSYGGSPQTVRQLQQAGIDTSPLKREVAQQIADRNFALTNGGRGLAGYSTEFLKTLYTPEEFNELTTMGRVGRAIRFEMNPSGTSNVMEGHRQIHGIIRRTSEALVGPFASRLTTSKALARATMGEPSPVQPRGVLDVMGLKPPEPPPGTPPASGGPPTPNQGPTMPPAPKSGGMAAATEERVIKSRPSYTEPDPRTAEIAFSGKQPNNLYRGISDAELRNIVNSGEIKSNSSTAIRLNKAQHRGMTFFSDRPHVATSYIDGDGYLIEIPKSALPNAFDEGGGEIRSVNSVPVNAITRIIRIGNDEHGIFSQDVTGDFIKKAASPADERGIKAPQKRTFERIDEKEIKQYFNYRFDQLRNEMKAAQATGDPTAISDVQRRMDELDQIQRQPKSIVDILGGKQPATAVTSAAEAAKDTGDFAQAKKNLPNATISQQLQEAQRLKDARTGKAQPLSVTSAVRDILEKNPSPEHRPNTPQQPMEAGKSIGGNYGSDTAVKTTSGSLPAKYKVVEADSLIPSHNAQTFAKNPQYPEGVQERDYARSKEAQARVIQQAQNYDPAYTVNTNPDAVNGPPVVTKDGIVLGGNSRTMSTQRLYKGGTGDAYRNSLRTNASQFGLTPAAIDNMKNPVLVREVETPANIEQARRIGADLNKSMTGAMGQGEKAVSAGRSVKPATLATISGMVNEMGEGATLRDVMRQNGKDIVSMMTKDGVISERERPQFVDTSTGGLNDEGKAFVERALVGSVVDDPRLMDRVPKSVLGKLEGSLGDLATIGARSDEYNLMPLVREALQEHAEMAMRGLDVNKYLAQSNMFGNTGNPAVEAMVRALAEKPKAFREAIKQYADDARYDAQGQGVLGLLGGGKPSAVKAFDDAFGANLTPEQFHNAVLQSTAKEGTIGTSGQPDQATGSNEGVRGQSPSAKRTTGARKTSATQAGRKTADQPPAVAQTSLSDIFSGKPQEKIDLNAPKSQRKIPPDVTAKADYSGQTVPAKAPTFFSKAEQVAEEKLPNSVKADQVIPTLQNAGVKAEEMKWLGLDDYLKGKDKVSKADLLDHIRENNLQVKEVLRGDYSPAEWESGQGGYRPETKFSQYQLPGGENYRELLLTLPAKEAPPGWKATYQGGEAWLIHDANGKQVGSIYGAKDAADAIRQKAAEVSGKMFQSSHFDEPNVLAHVRFNGRISPDGKKTLFLEELQSDWHQKGRKQGYQGNPMQGEVKESPDGYRIEWPNGTRSSSYMTREAAQSAMAERAAENAKSGVPDAPFKSTWQELAMKRMLRYAAENGYDRLAWTTGEQQAARYDLSKHVDELSYNPKNNVLVGWKDGRVVVNEPNGVPREKLADYIGKEAAQKLLESPTEKDAHGVHILSGTDLKVGGQGMKGFYDKILPDFMNKYGKKWGAKVGESNINSELTRDEVAKRVYGETYNSLPAESKSRVDDVVNKNQIPVHSVPITPAMRKDVIFKGQPIAKNKPPRSLADIFSGANA